MDRLRSGLGALPLEDYSIEATRVSQKGISGVYVKVITKDDEGGRRLADILDLLRRSDLDEGVKEQSQHIFLRLGEAEAKIHQQDLDTLHLHEMGAIDTVVDVVGSLIGLRQLGIETIVCSPINLGKGLVKCSHGWLPIPAPITAELLKGVPVYSSGASGELTTPTGAAIISSLATRFGDMPLMAMHGVGYGAGNLDLETPDVLRVLLGETTEPTGGHAAERVTVLETNIDDMNPQLYDHIMESLLQAGALDVFLTPVQMKKNRPGILLSVIAQKETVPKLLDILLEESTTLGVRVGETQRFSLPRLSHLVQTRFGKIRVKAAQKGNKIAKMTPEYDDCKKAARDWGVPISLVYEEVYRNCRDVPLPPAAE